MQIKETKAKIEAILFAAGRSVSKNEIMLALEISSEEIDEIISSMQNDYKEEDRYYFEYWKPNISVPVCKELTLPSEGEPFYCWVLEEAFGVASWNPQTQSALFTTFDRATLAPLSTTTAPHFPKPPSPERIPYVIRKCGDWIYVFDISMEYVLRFNLVTGGEERYCVKTK